MNRRPSLHDVAVAAGVSHMTVSRVVRGGSAVRPSTAERVRRAVEKLKYRPDPVLSALAAYRSRERSPGSGNTLAFLEMEKSGYTQLILAGVREEAARLGYAVITSLLPASAATQRQLSRQLFHRGIAGLLISPSDEPRRIEGWEWDHFAPVSLSALQHEPALHAVAKDYFHGLQTAWTELRRRGHRRIGLLLRKDIEARTGHLWLGAYFATARPLLKPFLVKGNRSEKIRINQWLASQRPDAVLTIHGEWHDQLDRSGVKVTYLNDRETRPGSPHIRLDPAQIGIEGVQLVHRLLLRRELGLPALPKMILLRGEFVNSPANPTGSRAR